MDVLLGSTVTFMDYTDDHQGGLANINSYIALQSGTVGHLSAFLRMGTAQTVFLGLYADNSGTPGALLTQGTINHPSWTKIVADGGDWVTVGVTPVPVTQGNVYWIAILAPSGGGDVGFGYHSPVNGSVWQHSSSSLLTSLPAMWSPSMVTGMYGQGTECSMYASP
jgi:hypothetical protein